MNWKKLKPKPKKTVFIQEVIGKDYKTYEVEEFHGELFAITVCGYARLMPDGTVESDFKVKEKWFKREGWEDEAK